MQKKIIVYYLCAVISAATFFAPCAHSQSLPTGYGVLIQASAKNECLENVVGGTYTTSANELTTANAYFGSVATKYIRLSLTSNTWYNGAAAFLKKMFTYDSAGYKVLLTVTWNDGTPGYPVITTPQVPYPKASDGSLLRYENFMDSLMNYMSRPANASKKPALYVIENEELNTSFHVINYTANHGYTDCDKYLAMLYYDVHNTSHNTAAIPVTNGGFMIPDLKLMYASSLDNGAGGRTAAIKTFEYQLMPPSNYYGFYTSETPKNPAITADGNTINKWTVANYMLTNTTSPSGNYSGMGMTYVNVHWYEPTFTRGWNNSDDGGLPYQDEEAGVALQYSTDVVTPGYSKTYAIEDLLSYMQTLLAGTQKIISNETGQTSSSPCLTTNMMSVIDDLRNLPSNPLSVVVWFDGDGSKSDPNTDVSDYSAKALHNTDSVTSTTTLRYSGINFRNKITGLGVQGACANIPPKTSVCGTKAFSVVNAPAGDNIVWSINPNNSALATISPLIGSSTTVTRATSPSQGNGTLILTANFTTTGGVCDYAPVSVPVTIGNPYPLGNESYVVGTGSVQGFQVFNGTQSITAPGSAVNFTYNIYDLLYSHFSWVPLSSVPAGNTYTTNGGSITMKLNSLLIGSYNGPRSEVVQMTAEAPCTTSYVVNITSAITNPPGFSFSVSPNPVSSFANVSVITSADYKAIKPMMIYAVKVTDQSGNVKKVETYKSGVSNARVSYTGLTKGSYELSVFNGNEWTSKMIIVQ